MLMLMPFDSLKHVVFNLLTFLIFMIFIDIVLSWVMVYNRKARNSNQWVRGVSSIVDPIVNPIRSIMPPTSRTFNMDFSPMIAMILLQVVRDFFI